MTSLGVLVEGLDVASRITALIFFTLIAFLAACGGGGGGSGRSESQEGMPDDGSEVSSIRLTTYEEVPLAILMPEPEGAQISHIVSAPAHGALAGALPTMVYTPNRGFYGIDSFTYGYSGTDPEETSYEVTVQIDVKRSSITSIVPDVVSTGGGTKVLISGTELSDRDVRIGNETLSPLRQGETYIEVLMPPQLDGMHKLHIGREEVEIEYRSPLQAMDISRGDISTTCAVLVDGTVACLGAVVGNGAEYTTEPMRVDGVYAAKAVSGTCALLLDGTVSCWQNVSGSHQDLRQVDGLSNAVDLGGDLYWQSCAVVSDGSVQCWSPNSDIEYGVIPVPGIADAIAIDRNCALMEDGSVSCWVTDGNRPHSKPAFQIQGISGATKIAVGAESCAILSDRTVECWKQDFYEETNTAPVQVAGIEGAVDIDTNGLAVCAVLESGKVKCWNTGQAILYPVNYGYLLGDGSTEESDEPVLVAGIDSAEAVSVNGLGACVRLEDFSVRCWGDATSGVLGVPDDYFALPMTRFLEAPFQNPESWHEAWTQNVPSCVGYEDGPIRCGHASEPADRKWVISGTDNAVKILGTMALLADGTIRTWSSSFDPDKLVKDSVPVAGVWNATDFSKASSHACALINDGTVRCWGSGLKGRLGSGMTSDTDEAFPVYGIDNAVQVSAVGGNTCAVLDNGSVKCWGENHSGQLGTSQVAVASESYSPVPVEVEGLQNAVQVSAGNAACARTGNGEVFCWGAEHGGKLGAGDPPGSQGYSAVPRRVKGVNTATWIMGDDYGVGVLAGDTYAPLAWGSVPGAGHASEPMGALPRPR